MIWFLESCSQVTDSQSLHGVSGLHRNPNSFGCWGTRHLSSFKCDLALSGPYRLIQIFWNFKFQEPGPGQPLWNVINQMPFVASDRNPIQNYLRRKRVIFYWSELLKVQGWILSGFRLLRCLVLNEVDHLSPPTVSSAHPLQATASLAVGCSRLTAKQKENFYTTDWETFLGMSLGLISILKPVTDQEDRKSWGSAVPDASGEEDSCRAMGAGDEEGIRMLGRWKWQVSYPGASKHLKVFLIWSCVMSILVQVGREGTVCE